VTNSVAPEAVPGEFDVLLVQATRNPNENSINPPTMPATFIRIHSP
jgi:hypothetical protein